MGTEKRGTKVTGLNCKNVNVSLEVWLVMSGLQGPGSNPWNVVGWSGRCSDQRLTGRVSSPSGVSDRLLQRPDGAGGPALFSAQHQSLLRGCLRLLWLHVLQPREGAQLRRVSAGLKFKVCVQLERFWLLKFHNKMSDITVMLSENINISSHFLQYWHAGVIFKASCSHSAAASRQ